MVHSERFPAKDPPTLLTFFLLFTGRCYTQTDSPLLRHQILTIASYPRCCELAFLCRALVSLTLPCAVWTSESFTVRGVHFLDRTPFIQPFSTPICVLPCLSRVGYPLGQFFALLATPNWPFYRFSLAVHLPHALEGTQAGPCTPAN